MSRESGRLGGKSRIDGGARLRRFLREFPNDVREPIRQALTEVSNAMLQSAKSRVSVDTGTLRDALTAKVDSQGLRAEVGIRGKRAQRKAFHGVFVEFGTRPHSLKKGSRSKKGRSAERLANQSGGMHPGMPARPFLHPAFEENKKDGLAKVRAAVQEAIRRAAEKS